MKLFKELNNIPKNCWLYYRDKENCDFSGKFTNFNDVYNNPIDFVQGYFNLGGKSGFLPETIFGNNYSPTDRAEYDTRAKHVVSTYFLGLYLFYNIPFLRPAMKSFLGENDFHEYLWAWYLCSLYHDAFYNFEEDNEIQNNMDAQSIRNCHFKYCDKSWRLLYDKTTIKRYYEKNKDGIKSFDGNVHYDHGILGAEWLFAKYNNALLELLNEHNIEEYEGGKPIFNDIGLQFDKKHFNCLCNIAKIIACHNIHICENWKDICKFCLEKLTNLIPGNDRFYKMPHSPNHKISVYEKLYYLLVLVDSLEPTKRGIDFKDLDISIRSEGNREYTILMEYEKFEESKVSDIEKMPTWLKFIAVEKNEKGNGFIITLDFNDKGEL